MIATHHRSPCLPRLTLAVLATMGVASAQASFTPFGSTCTPGQAISALNLPRLGQTFRVVYSGIQGNTFVGMTGQNAVPFLSIGLSNTQAGGTPLPYTLPLWATNGIANCELYVSPDATVPLPLGGPPPFTVGLTLPASQALVGLPLHLQWFTLVDRTRMGVLTARYVMLSNAATAVLGP